jgi:hypothetical protein
LPRQGSNLNFSDPESDVLPITPRGSGRQNYNYFFNSTSSKSLVIPQNPVKSIQSEIQSKELISCQAGNLFENNPPYAYDSGKTGEINFIIGYP